MHASAIILWTTLALLGSVGALAAASPRLFSRLADRSSRWVDTERILAVFDKRIDIDQYVLPYSRLLGAAVLVAVAVLARILSRL